MYPRRSPHRCACGYTKNVTPVTRRGHDSADAGDMRATSSCPSRAGSRHGADTPLEVCRHPGIPRDTVSSPQSATTSCRRDRWSQGGRRHDRGRIRDLVIPAMCQQYRVTGHYLSLEAACNRPPPPSQMGACPNPACLPVLIGQFFCSLDTLVRICDMRLYRLRRETY
jgi:hypothetical protein